MSERAAKVVSAARQRLDLELATAPLFVRFGVALFDALISAGQIRPSSPRATKAKVTVIETTAREIGQRSSSR